jgi:hypothetical protein
MSYAATCCEEVEVTRRAMSGLESNEAVVKSRENERESSSYAATDLALADAFEAVSEYFPLWRVSLFPSTSSRLFRQEEE